MTAYRLDHAGTRSNVGVPVASAVTISPRGEVFDGPVATEPGPTGEHAIMIWHNNVVDEPLAAFLVARGFGGRLRPVEDSEVASPRTEAMRIASPKHVRDWYAAEAIRLWEEGLREPQGNNRAAYRSLLRSWQSGPQEPAETQPEPEPEPAHPAVQPRRGTLTSASHKQALTAAVQAHRARMADIHGRPA